MQTEFQARVRTIITEQRSLREKPPYTRADDGAPTKQFAAKQARREAAKAAKADNELRKQIQNVSSSRRRRRRRRPRIEERKRGGTGEEEIHEGRTSG